MADFQVETTRTALKRHRCCECRGHIEPGSQYRNLVGCWDGRMDEYKQCLPCVEARKWALKQPEWMGDGEHAYYLEQLEEEIQNLAPEISIGDGRRFHAFRLVAQMRQRRQSQIAKPQR
ncbi:hypothetical protein LF844_09630 [Metapseudomonas lalkuanensis]|uniref:hypothetical protein n=1 Tax=Metapseudomonas lalkuanensis TaxID=2604832 RepID=UPI001CF56EB3|nr:hypothetical protein [Pseudomonas lalkuanensis]UCP00049.1 hypothetical protein LF844_09630 [Pseudomonas lalkuanensis]